MFREMRMKEQQLSAAETVELLQQVTHGTLAINGEGAYPYSVPVSFVYDDGKIYFHGAPAGQKYELMRKDPHVSLSVVALDDVQPKEFTTYYRSVVVYGKVKCLEDPEEIKRAMEILIAKYSPGLAEEGRKYTASQEGNFCAFELTAEHMTGKRSE